MANPFLGEIKLVPYNFAPLGWAFCAGQLLPISQNEALFALLGTTYGGDGQVTFALPDMRGRAVLNMGQGPGLSLYVMGELGGAEAVTLTSQQIPPHTHAMNVSSSSGSQSVPTGGHLAKSPLGLGNVYGAPGADTMPAGTIKPAGGNQPHENRQPYLGLNYVIALEGVFPPHP